ncbi:MAG: DUF1592 domain-containing protein, partial [Verrucomicrobiota bacterium]
EVERVLANKQSTGGRVVLRRLNRTEYRNSLRDLLDLDIDFARNLPPEPLSPEGFKNNGASLGMSALELEYMLDAARDALGRVIVEGPEPEVFTHESEKTTTDKNTKNISNRLGRQGTFVAKILKFPDVGDFEIRVKARAELPESGIVPRMRLRMGFRADTQTPSREIATVDVPGGEVRTLTFRGRIEEFPMQSRTQSKYPGQLVWLDNAYVAGWPAPKGTRVIEEVDRKGRKKKRKVPLEDPAFPKIVIESFSFKAPVFTQWPPERHRQILFESDLRTSDEAAYVRQVLKRFMRRAFRRPVEDAEVESFHAWYRDVRPSVDSLEEALRETLAMVLVAPGFLYLVEPSDDSPRPLTEFERASRLSYFLWSSMPDEQLMADAEAGRLSDPEALSSIVDRMLKDPKSRAFVDGFSDQWLDLDGIDRVAINPNVYPDFDLRLKEEMKGEARAFFGEVLGRNLSALNFIDGDFVMLNEPLARHYGLSGPKSSSFEPVALKPEDRRGGVLTQGGILLATSTGEDSHPIKRAVWIRERLLDDPPDPPPPDVPDLDRSKPDLAKLTLREQLAEHRTNPACADCHRGIDPWGVTMEAYDAIGLWRDEIRRREGKRTTRQPVVARDTLPDGTEVNGVDELKAYLLSHRKDQFARGLTSKLLSYALGRSLEFSDEKTVQDITRDFVRNEYRLADLIQGIVASKPFSLK